MSPSGTAPTLSIDGLEGPLDWLLEQARAKRIDLARISIAALIEAFETALLHALAAPDLPAAVLTNWADWLVMAADLTLLRSRLMLTNDAQGRRDAEAEAETLRRRLLTRAQTAAAAAWLDRRHQLGRDAFPRGTAADPRIATARAGDITALLRACLVALALPPDTAPGFTGPVLPLWTVADALHRLRRRLPQPGVPAPFAAFLPTIPAAAPQRPLRCRAAVASTLVGALELARDGVLALTQDTHQHIEIRRVGVSPPPTCYKPLPSQDDPPACPPRN